jgi:hypothetical protein
MIDFLKDANITDDTIIEIMKNNNEASLFNLSCNDEDAIQIINYMRGIGITNIDELLIYRIDIFFITFEQFIKRLSKFNVPILVNLINDNYANIDIINE